MSSDAEQPPFDDAEREPWRAIYQDAWAALQMIREPVETHSPPGTLMSEEAVLQLHGPEPGHEAQASCEALTKLLSR